MNEPFYMRVCSMNIGGRVLEYPPMTLEFETDFAMSGASSQTKAKVYNPAPDTVKACQKTGNQYPRITIDAGYKADHGTCVTGEIIKYEHKKGSDAVLEMLIGDRTSLWRTAMVNRTWRGSITARAAIQQILSDFSVTAAKVDIDEDHQYENLAFCGISLQSAMERIAHDTKSKFIFKNGQAYFLSEKAGHGTSIYLDHSSGLIKADKTSAGYNVKFLFNYQCWAGSLITIKTESGDVNCKVLKGKHKFSTISESITEAEAIRL